MSETPTLAKQCQNEIDVLEQAIAEALESFSARTGFVVEAIEPINHDYKDSEAYYSVKVTVKL